MSERTVSIATVLPVPLDQIERAWGRWLATLDGIPEERLGEPGVAGGWSIRDLAGHVAFWDEYAIVRANEFLAGRPRSPLDWQAMNDAEVAAGADRTVAEQRERMRDNHLALVDFLRELELDAAARAGLHERIRADTTDHYEDHAADVRAWRERIGIPAAQPATFAAFAAPFDRVESAWRRFDAAIDGLPEGRLADPGVAGGSSVKDLIGHVAFWLELVPARIDRCLAGLPDEPLDVQAMNDAVATALAEVPAGELRTRLDRARRLVAGQLTALRLDAAGRTAVYDRVRDDAEEHFDEHAAEIAAWRARAGL